MRRAVLILVALLAAVALLPAMSAHGAEGELEASGPPTCGEAPQGTSRTFSYQKQPYGFRVPAGVTKLTIDAQGGHGGQFDHTAKGGAGGGITGTIPVEPGECLGVYVGEFGYGHGGNGWAHGGDHGVAPGGTNDGNSGAGGGGASAVTRGTTPLAVAGGGGGGGGDAGNDTHHYGGPGGDAGAGESSSNLNPGEAGESGMNGDDGGCAGCEHGSHGGGGQDPAETDASESGAGGGGGGGMNGGGGGEAGYSGPVVGVNGGGGGGGAGSSYGIPEADSQPLKWNFFVSGRECRGSSQSTCSGVVQLSWQLNPARVITFGNGQAATVGTEFAKPLTAYVTDAAEDSLPGIAVTFTTPANDASATFAGGAHEVSTVTNYRGVAVTPTLTANDTSGDWSAEAHLAGLATPVRYPETNVAGLTSTTVTSSVQPSFTGEPVTFTAKVGGAAGGLRPTGAVEFKLDGALIATGTLGPDGVAVAPARSFTAGLHQVQAEYMGDESFTPSASLPFTQRVERGATGMQLTSSANPSETAAPVTFTAAVSIRPPAVGVPTGTVQFAVDGTNLGGPVALAADGTATSPSIAPALGSHAVTATYSGDAQFVGADGRLTQSVGPDATAAEVFPSVDPAFFGEPLRLTGVVRTTLRAPTGDLTFLVDGSKVCTVALREPTPPAVDSTAECAVPDGLAVGEHQVEVVYAGAGEFKPSTGTAIAAVIPARTATTVAAVPGDPVYGGELTLRASTAALLPSEATPTGGVLFSIDGDVVGAPVALDGEGVATLTLSAPLGAGPHQVDAEYLGRPGFSASSAGTPVAVAPARTTTTVSSSANPVAPGHSVGLLATVAVQAPGGGEPGGTVQFLVDGKPDGNPVPVVGGQAASAPIADLVPGSQIVTAEYSGDQRYAPSHADGEQRVEAPPAGPSASGGSAGGGSFAELPAPARARVLDRRVTATRGGSVAIRLRCVSPDGSGCVDRLTLEAAKAYPTAGVVAHRPLGSYRYRLAAGATRKVTVRLAAAGRRALAQLGRLRIRTVATPVGGSAAGVRLLTLMAPRSAAVTIDNSRVPVFANGRVRMQAFCDTTDGLRCASQVTIADEVGRPLAAHAFSLAGGRHQTIALLSPALRRLAGEGEVVTGEITAVSTSPAGLPTERSHRVVLLPVGYRPRP